MAGKSQPPRENPECKECQVPLDDSTWSPSNRKYRRYICRRCWAERQKRYGEKDPNHREKKNARAKVYRETLSSEKLHSQREGSKNRYRVRTYGITTDEYNALLESQEFGCAICLSKTTGGRSEEFHIDHCHSTGKVRGLLCMACNIALGKFNDNIDSMKRAIDYVRRNQ